jgi:hypothetical protein
MAPPLTTIIIIILQDISSRPEFNGCFACICGPFNVESGRWPVRVILKQGVVRNSLKTQQCVTHLKVHLSLSCSKKPT